MTLEWVVQPLASAEEAEGTGWYRYTECGLDNVWLLGGVLRHETAYGPGVLIKDVDGLNAAIANWILAREWETKARGRVPEFMRELLEHAG